MVLPIQWQLSGKEEGTASFKVESPWLYVPYLLVRFVGIAAGLELVLVSLKLDVYTELPWWIVFLPVIVALCIIFIVLTIAIVAWLRVAVLFFTGHIDVDPEGGSGFSLDVLIRTAKICFLGHGYVVLLMLSLALLLLKLQIWPSLPAAYPLLPLIVLGLVYIFLAVVFKQPEVDPPSFLIAGTCLFGQSIMLAIKLDQMLKSKSMPWAVTFTPSWLTYVLLLIYCIFSPLQAFQEAQADDSSRAASSADTHYGGAEGHASASRAGRLHVQLLKVAGISCGVIGCGSSQILLTLRLDAMYKVSWLSVILPALLGWILLLVFVTGLISEYFQELTEMLLATFSLAHVADDFEDHSTLPLSAHLVPGEVEERGPITYYKPERR